MSTENEIINEDIKSYFPLNQILNISRLGTNNPDYYFSYVKDIADDSFMIDSPSKAGVTLRIKPNDMFEVVSIGKNALWIGTSVALRFDSKLFSGVWLLYPELLEKIQRRESLRWELTIPVEIILIIAGQEKSHTCESFNISPEGIGIATSFPLKPGAIEKLRVKFNFLDASVESRAKICHTTYNPTKKQYITGCQLLDVNTIVSDKIYKYIIQKQLEFRRKGLI